MAEELEEFEYESFQDNKSISNYLKALIDGFDNRKIQLSCKDRSIVLSPNNLLQFSIKAGKKGNKNKLSVKISWSEITKSDVINEKLIITS